MIFDVLEVQNLTLVKKTFPQNFLVDNEFNTCLIIGFLVSKETVILRQWESETKTSLIYQTS